MNGELNSILESDLQEFVLAGTEEKVGARSVAVIS